MTTKTTKKLIFLFFILNSQFFILN